MWRMLKLGRIYMTERIRNEAIRSLFAPLRIMFSTETPISAEVRFDVDIDESTEIE